MSQYLLPGTLLHNGAYRIIDVLGRGGFGITYLAIDLNLDRRVAIKEFFPKDYCERTNTTYVTVKGTTSVVELVSQLKVKFLKEARNIAKFSHNGIIKIHAAFEENNTAYYIMDFINGMSLNDLIRQNGPLTPDRAINIITSIGESLIYVHEQRINHLDIKPSNIMWDNLNGCPVLIDFGLSKQYDNKGKQTSTTPMGISAGYAPIEQYKNGGISTFSPQTDIYALGATLYYLITGCVPPEVTDIAKRRLTFPSKIPEALKSAIRHAMSLQISDRPACVRDFIYELTTVKQISLSKEKEKKNIKPNTLSDEKFSSKLYHLSFTSRTPHIVMMTVLFVVAVILYIIAAIITSFYFYKYGDIYSNEGKILLSCFSILLLCFSFYVIIKIKYFTFYTKRLFLCILIPLWIVLSLIFYKIDWYKSDNHFFANNIDKLDTLENIVSSAKIEPSPDTIQQILSQKETKIANEIPFVPKPQKLLKRNSLPFNPSGCPYIYVESNDRASMIHNKSLNVNIYERNYTFKIGDNHPNGTRALIIAEGYGDDIFQYLEFSDEDYEIFFDEFGDMNSNCNMQITVMDFNNDNECELLLTLHSEDYVITNTFIFKLLPHPYRETLVKYLGVARGQQQMYIYGTNIIAPYGSQGLYEEYMIATNGKIINIGI